MQRGQIIGLHMATTIETLTAIDSFNDEFTSREIARLMDRPEREIRTSLQWLEAKGYIRCIGSETRIYCRGQKKVSLYVITTAGKLLLRPEETIPFNLLMKALCGL